MMNFLKKFVRRHPMLKSLLLPAVVKMRSLMLNIRSRLISLLLFGRNSGQLSHFGLRDELGHLEQSATCFLQDLLFPEEAVYARKLLIIVVPEHNAMSGGIFSFFSIADIIYKLRFEHEYVVLLMTRPNPQQFTYLRQKNFRNAENVFRFSQIARCKNAEAIYLHIPEYAVPEFLPCLDGETYRYLQSRKSLFINIMNQNICLMPEKSTFLSLRGLATGISQSVAHHAYFGQNFADDYDLPTLLLPAFTDISAFPKLSAERKEKLIIYSPDEASHKADTLNALVQGLPDYTLMEIRNISFDKYMELATKCRFSITFGEGFDGYLAQPIQQGGIGFSVYNSQFFPDPSMKNFFNIFESGAALASGIVERIRKLENNELLYRNTNLAMMDVYDRLYNFSDYVSRVRNLINRNFDLYPQTQHPSQKKLADGDLVGYPQETKEGQ